MKKDGIAIGSDGKIFLYLKTGLIGVAVLIGSLLLFAAGMTLLEGGFAYAPLFATLSAAAGAFAASFYLAKTRKQKGWLSGLAVGGIAFALLTVIGLATSGVGMTLTSLFRFVILTLCAMIGGILGVGKAGEHRYL